MEFIEHQKYLNKWNSRFIFSLIICIAKFSTWKKIFKITAVLELYNSFQSVASVGDVKLFWRHVANFQPLIIIISAHWLLLFSPFLGLYWEYTLFYVLNEVFLTNPPSSFVPLAKKHCSPAKVLVDSWTPHSTSFQNHARVNCSSKFNHFTISSSFLETSA